MTLRNSVIESLEQVIELITLADDKYAQIPENALSPIGGHIRHIIDHYRAFRDGLDTGCINYDIRNRNTRLESDPLLAKEAVDTLIDWFKSAPLQETNIEVISEISFSDEEQVTSASTISRELVFLISHTLHHIAYASLLARMMNVDVPSYLGIAPSTSGYLRSQDAISCAQ